MPVADSPDYLGKRWSLHVVSTTGKRFTYHSDDVTCAESVRDLHLANGLCAWVTSYQEVA